MTQTPLQRLAPAISQRATAHAVQLRISLGDREQRQRRGAALDLRLQLHLTVFVGGCHHREIVGPPQHRPGITAAEPLLLWTTENETFQQRF